MKILKYLFLLIILFSFGGIVFIATQKNTFTIVKSRVINTPKTAIYNYLNDIKNYKDWFVLDNDNSSLRMEYSKNTFGVGSFYAWSGSDGEGKTTTVISNENDSIVQKTDLDGALSECTWTLKDTLGGTKVTCKTKGEMSFSNKFQTFFNGGVPRVMKRKLEINLVNLDKSLDYELNTFTITSNGIVFKKGCNYLFQRINTKMARLNYNTKILIPYLIEFSNKNKIEVTGNPFVIYNSIDEIKGISNVSICIPIKNKIFTSSVSDIYCSKLEGYKTFKTTLNGDYSHRKTAWKKTSDLIVKNNEIANKSIPLLEVYDKGYLDGLSPSKWKTAIYIAVLSKNSTIPKPINPKPITIKTTNFETTELEPK